MPRAYRHLTWRVVDPDAKKTSSLDSELQSLAVNPKDNRWHWTTVARGNGADLSEIADALNRQRFTLGNITPEHARRKR